jgi:methylase of polypeptide subunit release factors
LRDARRKSFLARMFLEAMRPYEFPGEEGSEDEIEFLPVFMKSIRSNGLVLDLAGGYGRVTSLLVGERKRVVLTDLSIHSLKLARVSLNDAADLVQSDFLHAFLLSTTSSRVFGSLKRLSTFQPTSGKLFLKISTGS